MNEGCGNKAKENGREAKRTTRMRRAKREKHMKFENVSDHKRKEGSGEIGKGQTRLRNRR